MSLSITEKKTITRIKAVLQNDVKLIAGYLK